MSDQTESLKNPKIAPIFFALLWAGALEWFRLQPQWGLVGVLVVFIIISLWAFQHRQRLVSRRSFWLAIAVFMVTMVGMMSFLTNIIAQHVMTGGTALVIWFYLQQATNPTPEELQGRVMTFMMTWAYWAGMLALLSFGIFTVQPWWLLTIIGAMLYLMVAAIVWLDLQVPWEKFRRALPWMAWLGAELMLVVWWLPTSTYVGSIVATAVGMLFVHLCRHVWFNSWSPGRGRRYIIMGLGIIALVLITARWA